MKLFFSLTSLLFLTVCTHGQITVNSLNETFDATCSTSTSFTPPTGWSGSCHFTPASVFEWNCSPLGGRLGTPGFDCNSFISGVHYADTAWLFTPRLNLAGNTDKIYMRYDSKYEFSAAKLHILASQDFTYGHDPEIGVDWYDVGSTATPTIGPDDSVDWVTHYIELTPYKAVPLYVAFKYTSTSISGGRWTIDNISTTPWGLNVADLSHQLIPITIIGTPNSGEINISCAFALAGGYQLSIYDLVGHEVYSETLHAKSGGQDFKLSGLQLRPGMFFIKISNNTTYGVAKIVVQ
jgi:hypothetical protein